MSRLFDSIRGHQSEKANLQRVINSDQFPQAALFVGPRGIGKTSMALASAQALVCESEKRPCGTCGPCLRIEKKQSESLLLVEPEKTGIKIERSREINQFVNYRTTGRHKVVVINDAEKLNPQAANALLKTIEEPPPKTSIILVAPSVSSVLPTIRSRVQTLRFSPLSEEDLNPDSSVPTWVVRSAQGRFDRLEALREKEYLQLRQTAFQFLKSGLIGEGSRFSEIKDLVKDRIQSLVILSFWQQFTRDLMVFNVSNSSDSIIHVDLRADYGSVNTSSFDELKRFFQNLLQAERDIEGNIDRSLVFEDLWLKLTRSVALQEKN